jgi:Asp-tRNA(Asn)/Glu-tRNA(Gln) amidotransferase A subunit family amidase
MSAVCTASWRLDGEAAQRALVERTLTLESLVEAALERISDRDPLIRAWAATNPGLVRERAALVPSAAPLAGFLVGVKDMFDTQDFPTTYGSPIYSRHCPSRDAEAVRRLTAAGALVIGKTVSTEFATFEPAPTRNPHDPEHTPGGSSSGSAAAVADGHVHVALGTQTAGSVIRPASYCGVIGFKPSYARVSYDGVKVTAPALDTVGLFARCVADVRACFEALDARAAPRSSLPLAEAPPTIGFCRTPWWHRASPPMQGAIERAADALRAAGARVVEITLPEVFDALPDAHRQLMDYELSRALAHEHREHADQISELLKTSLRAGAALRTSEIQSAECCVRAARQTLPELFSRCDALLTPAAPGAAPRGLHSTGDPLYSRAWSALGAPCITLAAGLDGRLPLGLQLIADLDEDARLLSVAAWAERTLREGGLAPALTP